MNSTDGYFDVTANRTKIVTVPDGYEVRLHKIGSSEDIFPDGLSTKDIKDLNNTLVVDLSTPGTIDLKGTLLSNGQPLPTMDGVDTEIDKKITALNLSGTYATKAALTTVETTANAAAPQSTTYTKTECDNKYAPKSTTYTKTEVDTEIDKKITALNLSGTYATKAALTTVETTANAAAPQSTTYTKTECDNKYAPKSTTYTKTEVDTSLNSKANSADVYTKTECDGKFALLTTAYTKAESDNKYALKTDQSITSTSDKVQICNTSQQVANASAITVVNGGLIFQTDGKVFIGVNGAWVQLGVPIS